MKIYVYSETGAKLITPTLLNEFHWIQIKTIDDNNWLKPPNNCKDKLNLTFCDSSYINNFKEEIGVKILYFLKRNYPIEELIINCEAGISRSAGLAAAIEFYYLGTSEIIKKKPLYNSTVYSNMLEILINNN